MLPLHEPAALAALVAALRSAQSRDSGGVEVHEVEVGALDTADARELALTLLATDRIHLYRASDPGRRVWIVHHAIVAPSEERLLQRL